jgi:hypothetical protein
MVKGEEQYMSHEERMHHRIENYDFDNLKPEKIDGKIIKHHLTTEDPVPEDREV